MTHEQLFAHAAERSRCGSADVGAAFARECTAPGRDRSRQLRFLVADRDGGSEYVDFLLTGIGLSVSLSVEPLERSVEHFIACNFSAEARLAALGRERDAGAEPIALPLTPRHRRAALAGA